ncbi:glutathione S-transferase [Ceratobasidium sp. AG-Ba]|nr:glutathione S-transferase [Ceratobasidium sp. AG-Ba]
MSATYAVVGIPFSTFTRTITSALTFKGVPFEQKLAPPHSDLAREHNPFGLIPTLVITEDSVPLNLRESQAIARYLDRVIPSPSLVQVDLQIPEKLWELVSIIASIGFKTIEVQVVKPRVKSLDEGKESTDECRARIERSGGTQDLRQFFQTLDGLRKAGGLFLLGGNPTWPDFFLYPPVADLLATPDADLAPEWIHSWAKSMDSVKGIRDTHPGTLAAGGRP